MIHQLKNIYRFTAEKQFYNQNPDTINTYKKIYKDKKRICAEFLNLLSAKEISSSDKIEILSKIAWKFIRENKLKSKEAVTLIEEYLSLLLNTHDKDEKNIIQICKYIESIKSPSKKMLELLKQVIVFLIQSESLETHKKFLLYLCFYIKDSTKKSDRDINDFKSFLIGSPYVLGGPINESEKFYGRDDILSDITRGIDENHYLISGKRRIGKTSVLKYVNRYIKDINVYNPEYFKLPVFTSLEGVEPNNSFKEIMKAIQEEADNEDTLNLELLKIENYEAKHFKKDINYLVTYLARKHSERKVIIVLLLDELDAVIANSEKFSIELRKTFITNLGVHLRIVATCKLGTDSLHRNVFSHWANVFCRKILCPFYKEEAVKLIKEPVKNIFAFSDDAVNLVIKYSDREPLLIQRICNACIESIRFEDKFQIEADHVNFVVSKALTQGNPFQLDLEEAWSKLTSQQQQIILQTVNKNSSEEKAIRLLENNDALFKNMYLDSLVTQLSRSETPKFTYLFKEWVKKLN